MRLSYRKRRIVVCFAFLGIMAIYAHIGGPRKRFQCEDDSDLNVLQDVCNLYANNKIDGNLCDSLCIDRTIVYDSCTHFTYQKKVMRAYWNNKEIILKARHATMEEFQPIMYTIQEDGKAVTKMPKIDNVLTRAYNRIHRIIGTVGSEDKTDLFKKMWTKEIDDVAYMTDADIVSLWMLLQMPEYIFLKYFQSKHLPKIYGSCGYVIAMEYIPPGRILDIRFRRTLSINDFLHPIPWKIRIEIALGLMHLIKAFDTIFGEVMHICDMHVENFGLRNDNTVAAIDMDKSFPESRLFINQQSCTDHKDCDLLQCRGICDFKTNTCSRVRMDNNLQAVCRTIFSPYNDLIFRPGIGLLRYPQVPAQVAVELENVIDECINYNITGEKASGTTLYKKIYSTLVQASHLG